ncbi:MAG: hypothetical protein AAGF59_08295 [Pseudomonadota bacterium]
MLWFGTLIVVGLLGAPELHTMTSAWMSGQPADYSYLAGAVTGKAVVAFLIAAVIQAFFSGSWMEYHGRVNWTALFAGGFGLLSSAGLIG